MLGVKNVFRKDYNSIGPKLLYGIQRHFEGVDEGWLLADHDPEEIDIRLKSEPAYTQAREAVTLKNQGVTRDSDRGSYGIPDLSGHEVKGIMTSLSSEEMSLIEAVRETDPISRVGILSAVIHHLNEAKRDEKIRGDRTRMEKIDKAIKILSRAIAGT